MIMQGDTGVKLSQKERHRVVSEPPRAKSGQTDMPQAATRSGMKTMSKRTRTGRGTLSGRLRPTTGRLL
jgi:hypothetical protein